MAETALVAPVYFATRPLAEKRETGGIMNQGYLIDLERLWASKLRVLAENVRQGEREHREIANLAEQIEADYHGRFLTELLQNANDQAVKAGVTDAQVAILRTERHVGILNQGEPFDEEGFRNVTSIGLSAKTPDLCLGNKGVGFKAVFEVSLTPIIVSSASPKVTLTEAPPALAFRFDPHPFKDPDNLKALSRIAEHVAGAGVSADTLLAEAQQAAPFKFPLPLREGELEQALNVVPAEVLRRFQTLVLLEVSEDKQSTVEKAIDEITSMGGGSILFLEGISELSIDDRLNSRSFNVCRTPVEPPVALSQGASAVRVETATDTSAGPIQRQNWWIARRTIGQSDELSEADRLEEARAFEKAVRSLPGDRWSDVREVPVAVAIPASAVSALDGGPLAPHGRFCIGLPTLQLTGCPVWVHSHFHGNISRTAIDLSEEGQPYNRLLFDHAVEVFSILLGYLRDSTDLSHRRLVTLAFDRKEGAFGDALFAPGGLAHQAIILGDTGDFLPPDQVAIPAPEDTNMFLRLIRAVGEEVDHGFVLPERLLFERARSVVDTILEETGNEPDDLDARFLMRPDMGHSLVEKAAIAERRSGPIFWQEFLSWLVKKYPPRLLSDQSILPVGAEALLPPSKGVFFSPLANSQALLAIRALEEVVPNLPFFDESTIAVRQEAGEYTNLARQLAPESGEGLVRRPRVEEMVRHALAPELKRLSEAGARKQAVLVLAAVLTLIDPESDGDRVKGALIVPTADGRWLPSSDVYFGPGWTDSETESLLGMAYGSRARLMAKDSFEEMAGFADQRASGIPEALKSIGVDASPKERRETRYHAPLQSWSYHVLTRRTDAPPPFSDLEEYWDVYLEEIRHREANTCSGQPFHVREVVWVDGLERPESRSAVFDLLLRSPESKHPQVKTRLERADARNGDSTEVPALWVHAVQSSEWAVVPTTHGLRSTIDAWWIPPHLRHLERERYQFLPLVPARYQGAAALVEKLGIVDLSSADRTPTGKVVRALHILAEQLEELPRERDRPAIALATELYHRLQLSISEAETATDISDLLSNPVPMILGDRLAPVKLEEAEVVFLNDDPIRAEFVSDYSSSPRLPTRARQRYRSLLKELERILGEGRVRRTSESSVVTGFVPLDSGEMPLLWEVIAQDTRPYPIVLELGALVAFAGRELLAPEGEKFGRLWESFASTRLQRGSFPPSSRASSFLETLGVNDPVLQIDTDAGAAGLVEASWRVFGEGHRDVLFAYARVLSDPSDRDRFLSERRIGEEELTRVAAAIAGATEDEARGLMLVLVRRLEPHTTPDEFKAGVSDSASASANLPQAWLQPKEIAQRMGEALRRGDEAAVTGLLEEVDVPVEEWQDARAELGLDVWRFPSTLEAFNSAKSTLAAEIAALTAHRQSISTVAGRIVADDVSDLTLSGNAGGRPTTEAELRDLVLRAARRQAEGSKDPNELLVQRLITEIEGSGSFLPADVPTRDVGIYRSSPQPLRERTAAQALAELFPVACAVANSSDEELDWESVVADERVSELSTGWLANRYLALSAVRGRLMETAPRTGEKLNDAGAFASMRPMGEIQRRLLGKPIGPAAETSRTVSVLGAEGTLDDIEEMLREAGSGAIGRTLQALTEESVPFQEFRNRNRPRVAPPAIRPSRKKQGAVRGKGGGEDRRLDKELNGRLGESFVFEQFRVALPDFDSSCWISKNREYYGHGTPGSDAEGFDFRYADSTGALGEGHDVEFLIEVKATSEDKPEEFTLTRNELEVARDCHGSTTQIYLVVWVASVRSRPRIHDILFDPIALWESQRVQMHWKDLRVQVPRGQPEEAGGDVRHS